MPPSVSKQMGPAAHGVALPSGQPSPILSMPGPIVEHIDHRDDRVRQWRTRQEGRLWKDNAGRLVLPL